MYIAFFQDNEKKGSMSHFFFFPHFKYDFPLLFLTKFNILKKYEPAF